MKKSKNLLSKRTTVEKPYATYESEGLWTWHILKTYQLPKNEYTNKHALWYTAFKCPFTYGAYKYGDNYILYIISHAKLVYARDDFVEQYQSLREHEKLLDKKGVLAPNRLLLYGNRFINWIEKEGERLNTKAWEK